MKIDAIEHKEVSLHEVKRRVVKPPTTQVPSGQGVEMDLRYKLLTLQIPTSCLYL